MAIVVGSALVVGHGNGGSREWGHFVYALKEFLINQAGWTVAGSSNGTTGGMDAVDRITLGTTIFGADTWVVLQSPHASAADRIQLLFGGGASDKASQVAYNPSADYVGNTTAFPTSSYSAFVTSEVNFFNPNFGAPDVQFNFLADTTLPYGFAIGGHNATLPGDTNYRPGGLALIPLTNPTANAGKPYAVYCSSNGSNYSHTLQGLGGTTLSIVNSGRCLAEPYNPPAVPRIAAANRFVNAAGGTAPLGMSLDTNGAVLTYPIQFQHDGYFYGQSDFVRLTGTAQTWADTLSDGVITRARICFAEVNYPWDGTTAPVL